MQKIALFVDTFYPMTDGVVMVVDHYARRLAATCQVTVFAPRVKGQTPEQDEARPYRVVRCRSLSLGKFDYTLPLPRFDRKFLREIRNGNFDLYHIHSPFGVGKAAIRAAKRTHVPIAATIHSQYKRDLAKYCRCRPLRCCILHSILRTFDACDIRYAVNGNIKRIYTELGLRGKIEVIPNATDMPRRPKSDAIRTAVAQKYDIPFNDYILLFVGRINTLKNVLLLADSLSEVAKKRRDFTMIFVGKGEDEQILRQKLESYGLTAQCRFTGVIRDREALSDLYNAADLFCFPSMYDASSLVQLEAASQETPTLFARGAATIGDATEGLNCFVADECVEALGAKLLDCMNDADTLRAVGQRAAESLYLNWDDAVELLKEHYANLGRQYHEK